MKRKRLLAMPWSYGILLAFSTLGCSATGLVQTAQTLGEGRWERSIDPGINGAFGYSYPGPVLNGSIRYGVTDRIDIGGRLGTTVAEIQSKFLLTAPENPTIAISIAPTFGVAFEFIALGFDGMLNIPIPLLIGFKFGPNEFTLGPRIQNNIFSSPSNNLDSAYVLSAGLSVGLAAQVNKTFRVLPELNVTTPLVIRELDANSGTRDLPFEAGLFLFSFNLGFQFDSPPKKFRQDP